MDWIRLTTLKLHVATTPESERTETVAVPVLTAVTVPDWSTLTASPDTDQVNLSLLLSGDTVK